MTIVEELLRDKRIWQACQRLHYRQAEDLYQELFVILCEAPPEKLEAMKQSGYLHYWIIRTLCNMITPTGRFYKKYIVTYDDYGEGEKLKSEAEEKEPDYAATGAEVKRMLCEIERKGQSEFGWYKVNLLKLFVEKRNILEMQRMTGIPYNTIKNDLLSFKRELREHFINSDK
jgi:DNA-directed RNA polymerase specialized sigma24 family protein